jgi:hypothetical protein
VTHVRSTLKWQQVSDVEGFVRRWRQHFVDAMQPRFLPPLWRVDGPERTEESLTCLLLPHPGDAP